VYNGQDCMRLPSSIPQAYSILVYQYPPGADSLYARAKLGKKVPRYLSNTSRTL
jgi:hypothetical protein